MRSRKASAAHIKLGNGWRQFAFAQPDLDFIGVIRRGMEIGALAQDRNGAFWQINGDVRKMLNTSRITALLQAAKREEQSTPSTHERSVEQSHAVVVTIKRKRRLIVRD
jgi:hypothetical protein